jgi:zinc transport system substrate-binding protein
VAVVLLTLSGCGGVSSETGGVPRVFVSVPPQAWLVEQLAGDYFTVDTLLPKGRDPHTYEPEPRQVMALGSAALYFRIGVPMEDRVLGKVAGSGAAVRIVDTIAGIDTISSAEACHDDDHDHGHDHGRVAIDPHVWLGPAQLRGIAAAMTRAFSESDPAHAGEYSRRLDDFLARLDEVDAAARERLAPHAGRAFFVYHPAFGYFAAAYGLEQVAVEMGGREPTPKDLEQLIAQAREAGIRVIFVQPQFPPASAETVARAIGGHVAPLDDMAPNVLENIAQIAEIVASALENGP